MNGWLNLRGLAAVGMVWTITMRSMHSRSQCVRAAVRGGLACARQLVPTKASDSLLQLIQKENLLTMQEPKHNSLFVNVWILEIRRGGKGMKNEAV